MLGVTAGVVLLGLSEPREPVEATAIDLFPVCTGLLAHFSALELAQARSAA